jgi:hypothetical protein
MYGNLVKAVVDLERGILVVDAELHVDQEQYLLEQGSRLEFGIYLRFGAWNLLLRHVVPRNDDFGI